MSAGTTASGSRGIWRMARRATDATSTTNPAGRASDPTIGPGNGGGGIGPGCGRRASCRALGRVSGCTPARAGPLVDLEVRPRHLQEHVVEGGGAQRQAHHRRPGVVQGDGHGAHGRRAVTGVDHDLVAAGDDVVDPGPARRAPTVAVGDRRQPGHDDVGAHRAS